ncbi:nitroreductase family deazaflavin-dependent oxidoreductase [Streptomyces sp. F63]|uniref:nitroreductase family deazaflavin-dependent oxidoreductase n=1 Tax=Streptomyces sp. F63 TaxID=2824887 RepID=UPI001B398713|nr:nitroreductase family deazaflavin-dependent oxidoreductase [Streptomyces sp. F63]MBQ0988312.1 nitroreductase family deazaflavin-dependent oxidoreductase [Streptomyces sp. F63]
MDIPTRPADPVVGALLRSRFHRPLSRSLLLLTYLGRRTGRARTLPVMYARSGGDLYVLVGRADHKTWWRNLRPAAPVRLLLAGRTTDATAEVLDSAAAPGETAAALRAYRRRHPRVRLSGERVVMVRLRPRRTPARPEPGEPVNRRIVVSRYGGPEMMRLTEEAVPRPGPGEIRVAVTAAEVNFTDLLLREGVYSGGPKPPFTPGYVLAGVVDALGPGTEGWKPGQRVAAMTVHGAYTDYVCLPARAAVPVPPGVDPLRAVSVVFTYATAHQLLHRAAGVRAGARVLYQGAAGAVGTAVLQLGQLYGLEMYGTASGDGLARVAALGATAIDYTAENVARRVREETRGGADVVLDGIGGRTAWSSYRALRPGGRLVLFGYSAALSHGRRSPLRTLGFFPATAPVLLAGALPGGRKVSTYRIAVLRDRHPDWYREDVRTLFGLLARGGISPASPGTLPLEQAALAHERIGSGTAGAGKQVLLCRAAAGRDPGGAPGAPVP